MRAANSTETSRQIDVLGDLRWPPQARRRRFSSRAEESEAALAALFADLRRLAAVWGGGDARGMADELNGLASLSIAIDRLMPEEVTARREEGDSWDSIGRSLGISRQAAHARYGRQS